MNYDIIGDVHGCLDELLELIEKLGYGVDGHHKSEERKLIFVGDLVDRGPSSDGVLALLMDLQERGRAIVLLGNHDEKLKRHLQGKPMRVGHMLAGTLAQLEPRGKAFCEKVCQFLEQLPYRFADEDLLVVHGAVYPGSKTLGSVSFAEQSKYDREWALYGEVGGTDKISGYPIRLQDWARSYSGEHTTVVRGHSVVAEVETIVSQSGTRVFNVDTGCSFGGYLSALRYPELEVVQVKARKVYYEGSVI
jgi:protein phosphatase